MTDQPGLFDRMAHLEQLASVDPRDYKGRGVLQITGRELRDEGIQRAVAHADAIEPRWADQAFAFLEGFLARQPGRFTSEDVREASANHVPAPPSLRAWGGVFQKAAKRGLLVRDGYASARDPKVHCNVVTVWRAA